MTITASIHIPTIIGITKHQNKKEKKFVLLKPSFRSTLTIPVKTKKAIIPNKYTIIIALHQRLSSLVKLAQTIIIIMDTIATTRNAFMNLLR